MKPTMSRIFSTKKGSLEILNVFCRCGSAGAVVGQRFSASDRAPQGVDPSVGLVCKVRLITSATFSSSYVRGRPGRSAPLAHRHAGEAHPLSNGGVGFPLTPANRIWTLCTIEWGEGTAEPASPAVV